MKRSSRAHLATILFSTMLLFPLAACAVTDEDETEPACPIPGEVPISAQMRDEARAVGIPDNQPCWNPQDPNLGLAVAEAKQYLSSILCARDVDNYGGAGPEQTITKLNPGFAVCAARFLKAASQQVHGAIALRAGGTGSVCVNEGYRTQEKQMEYWLRYQNPNKACNPTNKVCEHTTGLAIDVNTSPNSNYPLLWSVGSQYGVTFYLGWEDPVHFRAATTDCKSAGTPFSLNTPTGASSPTGATIPTSTFDFPPQGVTPTQDPQTAFLKQLPQLVAPLIQSFSQPSASSASSLNTAIPLSSSVTSVTNPLTNTAQNTTLGNQAVTNPLNVPTDNTQVNIAVSSSVPTSSPLTIANPLSSSNTGSGTARSPLAIIEMLAGLDPGGSTPTGTSLPAAQVNDNLQDSATLDSGERPLEASTTVVPQTFTSSDLRFSPTTMPITSMQTLEVSRFSAMLTQLRSGLQTLLTTPLLPRATSEIGVWTPYYGYNR